MGKPAILITFLVALVASCAAFSCNSPEGEVKKVFQSWKGNYVLFASKKDFSIKVYDRKLQVIKRYPMAYGLNPDKKAKLYDGDNRTPDGVYRIVEILSMDAQKDSKAYRKLKMFNSVYFHAREGHYKYGKPNVDLGKNVYGPRFYFLDYPNSRDRERYDVALKNGMIPTKNNKPASMGGGIAIHGNNDENSIGHLASSGCLRMYNNDIIDLEKYIQINTPVIISGL